MQHELELLGGVARHTPRYWAKYRWTRPGLMEVLDDRYFIYGRWDKLFGCWHVLRNGDARTATEILPDWPILKNTRIAETATNMSALHHIDIGVNARPVFNREANQKFSIYLRSIPRLFQELAGPFGWKQWLVLDLCDQVPGFWRFLHDERRANQLGYVGSCLAAFYSGRDHSRENRRKFAEYVLGSPRPDVITTLGNVDVGKSDVRIVSRLPADAKWSEVESTLAALSDPRAKAALTSAEKITRALVRAADSLPNEFVHPNLPKLIQNETSADWILHLIEWATSHLTAEQHLQAAKSFGKLSSDKELDHWAEQWEEVGLRNAPFPSPPFETRGPLAPILDSESLKEEGRAMRNCVAGFAREVVAGQLYFFHWDGQESASVSFVSTADGKWQFEEALGYRNAPLSPETLKEIMGAIVI